MGTDKYILDGHRVVPEPDLFTWGMWMETADRTVRVDGDEATGWVVSTIFLGLNYRFGDGPPLVFETQVFAPTARRRRAPALAEGTIRMSEAFTKTWDGYQARYSTWDEAEAGHRDIVQRISRDLAIEQA